MTIDEYNKKKQGIENAYVRLRSELDAQFLQENKRFEVGDVVTVKSISGDAKIVIDKIEVCLDENGVPTVGITEARYYYDSERVFPYIVKDEDVVV